MDSQWLFPLAALSSTPSKVTSGISLYNELIERAKGVEFIFRVGVGLQLTSVVLCAASQYFHRFYMRYSFEDYPRQEVAAASLFLATKTEENARKLKDVSLLCYFKATGHRNDKSSEIPRWQKSILATEEILLDALCFDFTIDHPQAHLINLLEVVEASEILHQYAWTLVNDSTPLCVLYPSRVIAAACFVLAQRLAEGPNSASLDERIFAKSSASLPTPPHMHPHSPQSRSFIQDFFHFSDSEMEDIAVAVSIILDFYSAFLSGDEKHSNTQPLNNVILPTLPSYYRALYNNISQEDVNVNEDQTNEGNDGGYTPASMGLSTHHSEQASPSMHILSDQSIAAETTSPDNYHLSSVR